MYASIRTATSNWIDGFSDGVQMYKRWITKRCKHAACKCLNDVLLEIRCRLSTDSTDQPLGESTRVSDFQFVTSSYVHSKHSFCTYLLMAHENEMLQTYQRIRHFFFLFHNPPAICSPPSTKMLLLELPTPFKAQHTVRGRRSTVFSMLVLLSEIFELICKLIYCMICV